MIKMPEGAWLGSTQGLMTVLEAVRMAYGGDIKTLNSWEEKDEDDEQQDSYLLHRLGNTAVINIHGPLVSHDSFINRLFGLTSYPEIQRAVGQAVSDPELHSILLDVDSPGGAAKGLSETADFVRRAGRIMPLHTYTGGTMASAAYWLGAQGRVITAADTADVGSIGVIAIHREFTEMMAKDGIKATVIRAGKYKALGTPYEKLTPEAQEIMQNQLDFLYDRFLSAVGQARGRSPEAVRETMGEGREFIGEQALQAGLVDEVGFFESAVARLSQEQDNVQNRAVGNSRYRAQSGKNQVECSAAADEPRGTDMAKKKVVLTEAAQAALASGAAPEAALASAPEVEEQAGTDPAAALESVAPEQVAQAVADAPVAEEPAPQATGKTVTASSTAQPAEKDGLVAFLQGQLAERDAKVLDLSVKLRESETQLNQIRSTHAALTDIARGSAERMLVAMGGVGAGLQGLSPEALVEQHATITADFNNRFRVGGVAVVKEDEDRGEPEAADSPVEQARLRAVRLPNKR